MVRVIIKFILVNGFDNLSGSHHQSLMMTSAQVVETSVMSPTTVLLRTTLTRTIKPHKRLSSSYNQKILDHTMKLGKH